MDYAVLGREHTGYAAAWTTESATASALDASEKNGSISREGWLV